MRLAFAMLADAATVAGGKLYVHGGGWSRLEVDGVPTTHPSFSLVFALELDGTEAPGPASLDFDLVLGDEPVAEVRGWIDVPAGRPAGGPPALVTNELTFTNVPLPVTGAYELRIAAAGERLGRLDLHVAQRAGSVA
jgi:hypothetical protein